MLQQQPNDLTRIVMDRFENALHTLSSYGREPVGWEEAAFSRALAAMTMGLFEAAAKEVTSLEQCMIRFARPDFDRFTHIQRVHYFSVAQMREGLARLRTSYAGTVSTGERTQH